MSNKKFIILLATMIGSVSIGTSIIYRQIDSIRHGLCNHMGWFYKGDDGKYHDGL